MIDTLRLLTCAAFLLSVIADTMTGMANGPPLSLAYKAFVCAVAVSTLGNSSLRILGAVAAAFLLCLLHTTLMHQLLWQDVVWALRNIMLLVALLFFMELLDGPYRLQWQRRVMWLCAAAMLVFSANVLAGLVGIGLAQYSADTGYSAGGKGFIYAGNEMVTAMLAISGVLIIGLARSGVGIRIAVYLLLTSVLVLSGTKSGILGLFALIALREGIGVNISLAQRVLMLCMLGFAVWFGYDTLVNSFAGRRFTWFWETQGLARALLSNRDYWASLALENFLLSGRGILDLFLGGGATLIQQATGGKSIVEMDAVDFLVSYGLLGLVASHTVFGLAVYRIWQRRHDRFTPLAFTGLFVALSLFTGHVLNGGTSAPYLGVMLALLVSSSMVRRTNTASLPLSASPVVDRLSPQRQAFIDSGLEAAVAASRARGSAMESH